MRNALNVAVLTTLLLGCNSLRASTLTYIVTFDSGAYEYLFTLTNDGPDAVFDLFLHVPIDASNIPASTATDGTGWSAPAGWQNLFFIGPDAAPNTTFLEWGDDGPADDLQPGAPPLDGFGFTSTAPITDTIQYALNGASDLLTADPIPAPEPATGVLSVLAMALL